MLVDRLIAFVFAREWLFVLVSVVFWFAVAVAVVFLLTYGGGHSDGGCAFNVCTDP